MDVLRPVTLAPDDAALVYRALRACPVNGPFDAVAKYVDDVRRILAAIEASCTPENSPADVLTTGAATWSGKPARLLGDTG